VLPGPGVVETDASPGAAVVEDDGERARDGDQDLLQASVGVTAAARSPAGTPWRWYMGSIGNGMSRSASTIVS
jgi:hypothetical protein